MRKSTSGFTIIELLVIIIVIGILASITIVSYNSIQVQARNTEREVEVKGWIALFKKYKSLHGTYPPMANGYYCLGNGFPNGPDGQPRCRDSASTNPSISYLESGNTSLMDALKTVGTLPPGNRMPVRNNLIGPYVEYNSSNVSYPRIRQVFEGETSDCPTDMTKTYTGGGGIICVIDINRP